jgi:hypothetical protein
MKIRNYCKGKHGAPNVHKNVSKKDKLINEQSLYFWVDITVNGLFNKKY